MRQLNTLIRDQGTIIHECSYEEFGPTDPFDLIFCVNVFEHLPDWKNFIDWAKSKLSDTGELLILCPNYSFPYESHFGIPIVFNKHITHKIFRQRIKAYEHINSAHGLWNSLNFVKKNKVKAYVGAKYEDFVLEDHMIDRATKDSEFQKRQRMIATIAIFLRKAGFIKIIRWLPSYLPYMKLSLSRLKKK